MKPSINDLKILFIKISSRINESLLQSALCTRILLNIEDFKIKSYI